MSMSTNIVGFHPPDNETWKKMKKAWDACMAAGVSPPKEVVEFFNHETPDEAGVEVNLKYHGRPAKLHPCCSEYNDGKSREGFEIDLSKLPPQITKLRFYNSW